ncbi:type IV secretion system protein [Paraburkholderia sp. SIMBA_054]|uniref:type IV secretion system protein n=1 Tax=Paraburkholderia sp. SIMBA_054 TaxID=3085795 RepID=UPI00397900FB
MSTPSNTAAPTSFTPGPPKEAAARNWFERGGKLKLQSDRSYWLTVLSFILNLLLAGVILVMQPLKSVQTVVIHESGSGSLSPDFAAVDNYTPDQPAIAYFLSEWVENVTDINASVINDRLVTAGNFAIGDAADQLKDLIHQQNPLARLHQYPSLRRTYKRLSVNFIKNDTAVLRYSLTERLGPGAQPTQTVWVMTITFTRVPPHTQEQVTQNPAGLYVTSFNNNQESTQ